MFIWCANAHVCVWTNTDTCPGFHQGLRPPPLHRINPARRGCDWPSLGAGRGFADVVNVLASPSFAELASREPTLSVMLAAVTFTCTLRADSAVFAQSDPLSSRGVNTVLISDSVFSLTPDLLRFAAGGRCAGSSLMRRAIPPDYVPHVRVHSGGEEKKSKKTST